MQLKSRAAVIAALAVLLTGCVPAQPQATSVQPTETAVQSPQATVQATEPTVQPTATEGKIMEEYTQQTLKAQQLTENLKLTGRTVMRSDGISLDWSYSGCEMQGWFDGPVIMNCNTMGGYSAYIRVIVDDNEETMQKLELTPGSAEVKLTDAERGYHNIKIIKVTEPGNSIIRVSSFSFNGKLDKKPADGKLKIEIIGDSISCGAGVMSTESQPDLEYYVRDDDAYYAYSGVLSRNMKADINIVALSGWGVVCGGTSTEYSIPPIYEYTDALWNKGENWDFTSWQPDVVIISLGTNDYELANNRRQEFIDGCDAFIKKVRAQNPDAYIIWAYGMINVLFRSEISDVVKAQNDAKTAYLFLPSNYSAGWGHPTKEYQAMYAERIEKKINEMRGEATE